MRACLAAVNPPGSIGAVRGSGNSRRRLGKGFGDRVEVAGRLLTNDAGRVLSCLAQMLVVGRIHRLDDSRWRDLHVDGSGTGGTVGKRDGKHSALLFGRSAFDAGNGRVQPSPAGAREDLGFGDLPQRLGE